MENTYYKGFAMRDNKLLKRKVYPEVPPRVEYSLSPLGQTLDPLLKEMAKWGEYYRTLI